jgi:FkbM family methyltransferase
MAELQGVYMTPNKCFMKSKITACIRQIVGRQFYTTLVKAMRRWTGTFSELDIIVEYFNTRGLAGCMIDVGAHHGESIEPFLGMGWSVVAFEPDARNRTKLIKRLGSNEKLKLLPIALSDNEALNVPFFISSESDGISSLSPFRASHREAEKVQVRALRSVLAELSIKDVAFLKIDAEGHDLFVMRGFPWETHRPEIVLCEFEDSKTIPLGYSYVDLCEALVANQYAVFISEWHPIQRYGTKHKWKTFMKYPCRIENPNGWGNIIALANEQSAEMFFGRLSRRTAQTRTC